MDELAQAYNRRRHADVAAAHARAVTAYQLVRGLDVDGKHGPATDADMAAVLAGAARKSDPVHGDALEIVMREIRLGSYGQADIERYAGSQISNWCAAIVAYWLECGGYDVPGYGRGRWTAKGLVRRLVSDHGAEWVVSPEQAADVLAGKARVPVLQPFDVPVYHRGLIGWQGHARMVVEAPFLTAGGNERLPTGRVGVQIHRDGLRDFLRPAGLRGLYAIARPRRQL